MKHSDYINIAIEMAKFEDDRTFKLGAVGIRTDGVIVTSRNGNSFSTKINNFQRNIKSHAEGRILRKLDHESVLYIARIKGDNEIGLAKPCKGCCCMIRSKKISNVYYTIDNNYFALWIPKTDKNYVFEI